MEYVVDLRRVRRNIQGSCRRLINDEEMADALFVRIMDPLEDAIVDDAPEVVRCKDCKYWDRTECIDGDCFCEKMFGRNMGYFTKENWYCAEGEKK